ncbi:MAG: hypothetical protein ACK5O2_09290, partial [Microthrixaceae bacterium]
MFEPSHEREGRQVREDLSAMGGGPDLEPAQQGSGLSPREAWLRVEMLRERWAQDLLVELAATEDAPAPVTLGDLGAVDSL